MEKLILEKPRKIGEIMKNFSELKKLLAVSHQSKAIWLLVMELLFFPRKIKITFLWIKKHYAIFSKSLFFCWPKVFVVIDFSLVQNLYFQASLVMLFAHLRCHRMHVRLDPLFYK